MLGWNVIRSVTAGALPGARSMTVCGAGNSSVLSMKQAGKEHASPGAPSLGNGGNRKRAAMSMTTTAAISSSQRLRDDAGYRSMVSSFVKALGAGTAYAKRHPAIALSVMRANSSRDYAGVLETSVPETLRLLDTTALDPVAWNTFGRWMQSQGLLKSPPDGAALVATP